MPIKIERTSRSLNAAGAGRVVPRASAVERSIQSYEECGRLTRSAADVSSIDLQLRHAFHGRQNDKCSYYLPTQKTRHPKPVQQITTLEQEYKVLVYVAYYGGSHDSVK
jgi:hypothetical protein